jgi:hypothetical protein
MLSKRRQCVLFFAAKRMKALRFGTVGLAAIYTGKGPDIFKLLRQLEIRSQSWLNYFYNPF